MNENRILMSWKENVGKSIAVHQCNQIKKPIDLNTRHLRDLHKNYVKFMWIYFLSVKIFKLLKIWNPRLSN